MKVLLQTVAALLLMAVPAQAHMLWVNSFESFEHLPGHTTVSIGWGHALPIDDMTNGSRGRTAIKEFTLTDPAGKVIRLHTPTTETAKPFAETPDIAIFDVDTACQKIAFNEKTSPGTYLVAAKTKRGAFTRYVDSKGRTRLAMKPADEVKDAKEVLVASAYQAFAKSYFTIGEWVAPQPVGYGLEITPLTDLSKVKVGDMVEVDVRCMGKPLSKGPGKAESITALSPSFGHGKYELFSYINDGKAQFEVLSAGQWVVNVFHTEEVTKDGPLKEYYGKFTKLGFGATLSFTVK